MTTLLSILGFGVLFAIFAFVELRPRSGSHCNSCTKSCLHKGVVDDSCETEDRAKRWSGGRRNTEDFNE
jgi:hypothetical protein